MDHPRTTLEAPCQAMLRCVGNFIRARIAAGAVFRTAISIGLAIGLGLGAPAAHASFLSGEAMDKAADVIAMVVLFIVPVVAVSVFWLVHILPEKVAEKREHPQKETIKVICLLSLVFGGMLWPIAWIMAYSKPILYKMAYGREKHDDYYKHLAEADGSEAMVLGEDIARLRAEIDVLAARGKLPEELLQTRDLLADLEGRLAEFPVKEAAG